MPKDLMAVDVGGTFVDAVLHTQNGEGTLLKFPKQWLKRERSPFGEFNSPQPSYDLLYSTTLTLNRLLSGKVPRIGLVVARGFHTILETARLPSNHDDKILSGRLIPLELVKEVQGRINYKGKETEPLCHEEIVEISNWFVSQNVKVIVVALINSYAEPKHELKVANYLREGNKNLLVIPSTDVVSEMREYERTLAAAVNGCITPIFEDDLGQLIAAIPSRPSQIHIMQSNGGIANLDSPRKLPIKTILSGPAAAVNYVKKLTSDLAIDQAVSLDIGGTSTDIGLLKQGMWLVTNEKEVAGFPIRLPMINVKSIGAGGGSIAHKRPNGRWHVGPESVGADPGPACYNFGGTRPTLTDAHFVLGRLPKQLAGGKVGLNMNRAKEALSQFGQARDFSVLKTAFSILELATYDMCGAVRRLAATTGEPIDQYTIFAIGGAGPLHAAELSTLLGIRTVIVPIRPGAASALGLLYADALNDFVAPFNKTIDENNTHEIVNLFEKLETRASRWLKEQQTLFDSLDTVRKLDLRYKGMTHNKTIDCPVDSNQLNTVKRTIEKFHQEFEALTGQFWKNREEVEIINVRVTAIGKHTRDVNLITKEPEYKLSENKTERPVGFLGYRDMIQSKIYVRDNLKFGKTLPGPCVVEQSESTTIVPPGWSVSVDERYNLLLKR